MGVRKSENEAPDCAIPSQREGVGRGLIKRFISAKPLPATPQPAAPLPWGGNLMTNFVFRTFLD